MSGKKLAGGQREEGQGAVHHVQGAHHKLKLEMSLDHIPDEANCR